MAEERMIILNLRRDVVKDSRRMRERRLMSILRKRVQKIFKDQKILIDKSVNDEVWKGRGKNLTTKLKLKATKTDEKTVKVELGK